MPLKCGDKAFRCFIYATGATRAEPFWANVQPGTYRRGPVHVDELDMTALFPFVSNSTRVHTAPGTDFPLSNDFRIWVQKTDNFAVCNRAVQRTWKVKWFGNIVVAKYSRRLGESDNAIQIPIGERSLVDLVVGM